MRYNQIREIDIANGEGIGIALFVQGCHFHCKNCFNKETWDFNGGKEWTPEIKKKFLELASRPYIKRISILGGEPLANENLEDVFDLINEIYSLYPEKKIWLYTGYEWEIIQAKTFSSFAYDSEHNDFINRENKRKQIVSMCDILIDGKYIDSQKDISLKWRGSKNQRVINIEETLKQGQIILWCD